MIIAKQIPTHPGLGMVIARQHPTHPGLGMAFGRHLHGPLDIFESPVWEYRKWIVLGGVALIGLSLMAGGAALLR